MSVPNTLQRILVVDDDRFIRAAVEKVLTIGGYTVKACEGGAEAIKQAPDFAPDLILLDVMMPGLDGTVTLKTLRVIPGLATTPVIFLTATTDAATTDRLRSLGAIDVFKKPFNPKTLAEYLEAAWATTHAQDAEADAQQLAAELDALRMEYAAALPDEMARIKQAGTEVFDTPGDRAALRRVRNAIHSLNGSGASFGFQAVTETASRLESEVDQIIRAGGSINPTQRNLLLALFKELEEAAHEASREAEAGHPATHETVVSLPVEVETDTTDTPRLLIVDDVEAVRRRYSLLLGAAGFIVDGAESGAEAINKVRRQHYDLILMDLYMPDMDGFETQQRLRQEPSAQNTPIIFMTATPQVDMGQIQEALAWGVSGFAPKSLPFPQLVREIRSALEAPVAQ